MNAPEEPAIIVTGSLDAEATLSIPNVQYRDEVLAASAKLKGLAYPAKEQFELYASSLAELTAIEKKHTEAEDLLRKKPNAFLKAVRGCLNKFLEPLQVEKTRLQRECGAYQLAERRETERREREAAVKLAEAAKAEEEAKAKMEAATTDAARMKAELELERANLTAQTASAALAIPKDAPKGTRTRISYDFEVTNPMAFIRSSPQWFDWKAKDEQFHVKRKELLKEINGENSDLIPPDGQNSVTHTIGLRVFISVNFTAK